VDLAGRRPTLKGDLVSHTLDFHDLAPLVGAPPSAQATASAAQQQRAAARAASDRVLPDEPFRLERLRAAGADVSFRGARLLGSMTGDVILAMEGGRISKLLLNLADLDVAGSATLLVAGDKSIPIRCLVADFHADDGRMRAQTLVLDSTDTRLDGTGTIDFKDEGLGLRLAARSKRPSLVALRGPIQLGGRFKAPTVRPDPTQLTLRAGAAIALGFIAPPAAILPFLELGVAKDANCGALVTASAERVRAAGRPGLVVAAQGRPASR